MATVSSFIWMETAGSCGASLRSVSTDVTLAAPVAAIEPSAHGTGFGPKTRMDADFRKSCASGKLLLLST